MTYWLSFEFRMLPGMANMSASRKVTWESGTGSMAVLPGIGDRLEWHGDGSLGIQGAVAGTFVVTERTFTYENRPSGWVCSVMCIADHVPEG